mmetsp:Transcript_6156/g.16050  ORF Transcript_6156/g.16050 Transcript_6156/m.16050 type:complete len:240 (-) Transcript_6156:46-765(-)
MAATSRDLEVSSFVQDFLQEESATSGVGFPGKKRLRDEEVKADRKRERERKRRAEVGEKFDELTRVLTAAEAAFDAKPATSSEDAGSRADVLQRTIDALTALSNLVQAKPSADERSAAGGLLGVANSVGPTEDISTQTDEMHEVVVIAQTTIRRAHLDDLLNSNKAIVTASPHVAAAAAAASAASAPPTTTISTENNVLPASSSSELSPRRSIFDGGEPPALQPLLESPQPPSCFARAA